jgi:hypothetical protein
MRLYLFWSTRDIEVFGFTFERTGNNLPIEFAPWSKNGDGGALYANQGGRSSSNGIVEAVQRDGFYLARCEQLRASPGIVA